MGPQTQPVEARVDLVVLFVRLGRTNGDGSFQQSLDGFSELFLTTSQARLAVVGCATGVVAVPQLLRRELPNTIPRHKVW